MGKRRLKPLEQKRGTSKIIAYALDRISFKMRRAPAPVEFEPGTGTNVDERWKTIGQFGGRVTSGKRSKRYPARINEACVS